VSNNSVYVEKLLSGSHVVTCDETLRLSLKAGEVYVVLQDEKKSSAFVFKKFNFSFLKEGFKNKLVKSIKCTLIGKMEFCEKLETSLKSIGIIVEKTISRENDFEVIHNFSNHKVQVSKENVSAKVETLASTSPMMPASKIEVSVEASRKTRVLIVDDSKTIRVVLEKIFSTDPNIQVVGSLGDPREVEKFLSQNKVDVMTLDIHMPELSGLDVLKMLMPKFKIPTIMISSISKDEGPQVLQALELGAVDYIQKPKMEEIPLLKNEICERLHQARNSKVRFGSGSIQSSVKAKNTAKFADNFLIVVGSSTGGTEALKELLMGLPDQIPPILIVQHIPAVFSAALAHRLNELCPFAVMEAVDQQLVQPNTVLIAPGGKQMKLESFGLHDYRIRITDDAPVNRHKPSVDYLFDSVAKIMPSKCLGVILTGMGADGAQGLLKLKKAGAWTIAQDKDSSVVWGMPRAAAEIGAACEVRPLNEVASALVKASLTFKKTAA
jgi:two-component system, chemotaxis family, protein-glutamate methylesterase/glutaminase